VIRVNPEVVGATGALGGDVDQTSVSRSVSSSPFLSRMKFFVLAFTGVPLALASTFVSLATNALPLSRNWLVTRGGRFCAQ